MIARAGVDPQDFDDFKTQELLGVFNEVTSNLDGGNEDDDESSNNDDSSSDDSSDENIDESDSHSEQE